VVQRTERFFLAKGKKKQIADQARRGYQPNRLFAGSADGRRQLPLISVCFFFPPFPSLGLLVSHGDDWAHRVFAGPFSGDERPPGMARPAAPFPSLAAARIGAPQNLAQAICIRIWTSDSIFIYRIPTVLDFVCKKFSGVRVHTHVLSPVLGPPVPISAFPECIFIASVFYAQNSLELAFRHVLGCNREWSW
jgi:hypothetical protein